MQDSRRSAIFHMLMAPSTNPHANVFRETEQSAVGIPKENPRRSPRFHMLMALMENLFVNVFGETERSVVGILEEDSDVSVRMSFFCQIQQPHVRVIIITIIVRQSNNARRHHAHADHAHGTIERF